MVWLENLQEKNGKKWLVIPAILLINMLVVIFGMLSLNIYFGDINLIVSDWIGANINLVLLIFFILLLPLSYAALIIFFKIRKLVKTGKIRSHLIHTIVPIILILLFDYVVYYIMGELGDYAITLKHMFDFYFIFAFLAINIVLLLFIYILLKAIPILQNYLSDTLFKPRCKKRIIIGCFVGVYAFCFSLPFVFIPTNVINWELPPKPDLIAHRGASHIAPENTIEACEMAIKYGCVGWEIDVQISYDGHAFLMHDDTLTRCSNVKEIFPEKANQDASLFTLSELRQLDAGSWFVDKDPYGAISKGIISPQKAEEYRGIKIPTLNEVLTISKDNDLIIDFDTKGIPSSHPYHSSYKQIIVDYILASGIDQSKIMISYNNFYEINIPNAMFTGGNSLNVQQWLSSSYDLINTGDGFTNGEYRARVQADIPVMVYTIDTVERFTELWCLGVEWVKTNEPHAFSVITRPIWYLQLPQYFLLWILVYSIGISLIVCVFYVLNKRTWRVKS